LTECDWNISIKSLGFSQEARMTKDELVEKIKELLRTDFDLNFLLGLKKDEIETLVACIRDRVDQIGQ